MDGKTVDPIYLATVPQAERVSRAELIATADKYFSGMQKNDGKGDYPFADDCNRLENGGQTTNAPTPAGPDAAGSEDLQQLLRAVELHGTVQVRPAALRQPHP